MSVSDLFCYALADIVSALSDNIRDMIPTEIKLFWSRNTNISI